MLRQALLLLHLLAAMAWMGGMFFAYFCLRPSAAEVLEPPKRLPLWLATLGRFLRYMSIAVLLILLAQLLLGLGTIFVSLNHLDGEEMVALMNWAQHIVTFRMAGAADYIADAHWIFRAHVFLGLTLFLIAPFTRLVHILSAPVRYVWRPYQVVRSRAPRR